MPNDSPLMDRDRQTILPVGETHVAFNYEQRDIALFVALGAALAQAQVLEFGIAHLLGLIESGGDDRFKEVSNGLLEKTLGALARKVKGHATDPALANKLEEIVEKRNFVAHRVLQKYQWPIMSDDSYLEAIRELDAIREFLTDAEVVVTRALKEAKNLDLIVVGIDPETQQPRVLL